MRIAIVRTSSTVLAAETYNIQELGLARELASRGHACDVYLAGSRARALAPAHERAIHGQAREIRLRALALPGRQGLFRGLRGQLERGAYDLIQVHEDTQVESVRVSAWAHGRGIPVVLCQGMYADYAGATKRVLQRMYDRTLLPVLRRATRMVSAKSTAAGDYCRRKGFRAIVVNPIGLGVEAFAQPQQLDWRRRLELAQGDRIVLYVGALEPRRRGDVLIEALARVLQRHGDVVLVLVGDGPSREALRGSARSALGERVRWIARATQAELPQLYAAAAVSVLPSMFEIYGMAALESMYFGTPVIASRVGGLVDLIEGDSGGALVESYDPSVWAAAIQGVVERGVGERQAAARAARARADGLTWSALGDRYEAFFERVVRADEP